jgi:serine/threonine protein kinase
MTHLERRAWPPDFTGASASGEVGWPTMLGQPSSPCPDDETIAAFVSGTIDATLLRTVDAHLASCESCRQIAGAAAAAVQTEPSVDGSASTWRSLLGIPELGAWIAGKYRVEELLGQGGMGVVVSATDVELGRRVAIKVMSSDEPTATARFLREARNGARLADDHIVRVFESGRLPNGVPFLVMEHLTGETLAQRIARAPISLREALDVMQQVCAGLTTAHAAGIVHRDLKPSNLFLVHSGSAARALKILDFGMSRLLGIGANTTLTLPRTLLGSPSYMSPEQALGGKMDARTDIWSLGVILYELVVGCRPFVGKVLPELLLAIATRAPAPPSALVADLPQGLDAWVLGSLAKDVRDRIPSIGVWSEQLTRVRGSLQAGLNSRERRA